MDKAWYVVVLLLLTDGTWRWPGGDGYMHSDLRLWRPESWFPIIGGSHHRQVRSHAQVFPPSLYTVHYGTTMPRLYAIRCTEVNGQQAFLRHTLVAADRYTFISSFLACKGLSRWTRRFCGAVLVALSYGILWRGTGWYNDYYLRNATRNGCGNEFCTLGPTMLLPVLSHQPYVMYASRYGNFVSQQSWDSVTFVKSAIYSTTTKFYDVLVLYHSEYHEW